jgi:hypothetical protein
MQKHYILLFIDLGLVQDYIIEGQYFRYNSVVIWKQLGDNLGVHNKVVRLYSMRGPEVLKGLFFL